MLLVMAKVLSSSPPSAPPNHDKTNFFALLCPDGGAGMGKKSIYTPVHTAAASPFNLKTRSVTLANLWLLAYPLKGALEMIPEMPADGTDPRDINIYVHLYTWAGL